MIVARASRSDPVSHQKLGLLGEQVLALQPWASRPTVSASCPALAERARRARQSGSVSTRRSSGAVTRFRSATSTSPPSLTPRRSPGVGDSGMMTGSGGGVAGGRAAAGSRMPGNPRVPGNRLPLSAKCVAPLSKPRRRRVPRGTRYR